MDTLTLSKIAHELRTPLTLINSTLQMIEAQLPQMKELKHWIQLNEDFHDMVELVSRLTTLQKNPPLMDHYPEEADLYHMLQSLQENFLLDELGADAVFSLSVSPEACEVARHFHCDRIQLKQVCTNLIKNALEATAGQASRNIQVSLSTQHIPMAEDLSTLHFLCIRIQDNGPGIPPHILPLLYTPYVSGKDTGTGIGLSITKNIVQEHGGYLDVESSSKGTVFLVHLPYIL